MNDFLIIFLKTWFLSQIISIFFLRIGVYYSNNKLLLKIGSKAHHSKIQALDRFWPLTKIHQLVADKNTLMCSIILSTLIIVKSIVSLVFGVIMIFWLPLASLIVPSIITVHEPGNQELMKWIFKVSILQVTSHSMAAALGFTLYIFGPMTESSLSILAQSNFIIIFLICLCSLGFAIAAGKTEAEGIIQRGI